MYVYVAPTQYASALNFSLCLPFHARVNQSIRSPCPRSMEKRRVFFGASPLRLPLPALFSPSAPSLLRPLPFRAAAPSSRLL